jgi:ATP-dependent helicase/DNAse subunit B
LEVCLRSAQLPSGRVAQLEQLEYRHSLPPEAFESEQRAAQVAVAWDSLQQLDQLLAALPSAAPLARWREALQQLLVQLGALAPKSATPAAAAWQKLQLGLREIEQIDNWAFTTERSLSLGELQELITLVASQQRVAATHDAVGRVRVLSAESARKLSTKYLFLAGLGEQAFASTGGDAELGANLPEGLAPAADSPRSDAMLLFYELVSRPTVGLTLSYSALDAKGQPLSPSPLLGDLERSLGRLPSARAPLGALAEPSASSLSQFRRQAVNQALTGQPRWLAGLVSTPPFTGRSILAGIESIAHRGGRDLFGAHEGLVQSESARQRLSERFDTRHLWSPSQLEGYAACPFRFFSEQLLNLQPLDELTLSNDPRRRGSLLHQVLATVHQQLKTEFAQRGDFQLEEADLTQRFLTALDEAVRAFPLRGLEQSLREIERREIQAWAPHYAAQEIAYRSQWNHLDAAPRPEHLEVRFGPETRSSRASHSDPASTPRPFELDLGEEQILLTGQIDRIDLGQVGGVTVLNIIDYKSGKEVKLKLEKIRSGHQLQLPLYALAAEQLLLADQGALALASGYWNIQGKGFQHKNGGVLEVRELVEQALRESPTWQQLRPEVLERVQQLIHDARSGAFPVYNQDEKCTSSCSLSTVCRVGQIRSLEKTWPPSSPPSTQEATDGN